MLGIPGFSSMSVPRDVEEGFASVCDRLGDCTGQRMLGRVVQLDRSLPLVCTAAGSFRAEHAVWLVKQTDTLAAIGDWVVVDFPPEHENAVIQQILPRKNFLSRPGKGRKGGVQTLAANIDTVFIVIPMRDAAENLDHLERQLVLAYQSGAEPVVVLSKADEVLPEKRDGIVQAVEGSARDVPVMVESVESGEGVAALEARVPAGKVAVMLGKSGVGKSSLLNALVGGELQRVGAVRAADGSGRHTTIARRMVLLPRGGLLIDSPGLRSFLLTGSFAGVEKAFPDVVALAQDCRFRDCRHSGEPGCQVVAAVERGELPQRRFDSYLAISEEVGAKDGGSRDAGRKRR